MFGNGTVLHEQVAENMENRVLNKVFTNDKTGRRRVIQHSGFPGCVVP
jgi:hypothetical protein